MAYDNNKIFTADDIEKYHKGMLSAKEMHELEKAALDDPFLAEAMDGYAVAGVNVTTDMAELKNRLIAKTSGAKIISIPKGRRKNLVWLKVAAAIVVIAVSALLVNQFLFTKQSTDTIAQVETEKKEAIKNNDSTAASLNSVSSDTNAKTNETINTGLMPTEKSTSVTDNKKSTKDITTNEKADAVAAKKEEVNVTAAINPSQVEKELASNETSRQEIKTAASAKSDRKKLAAEEEKNSTIASNQKADEQTRGFISNTFRGRITDINNIPIPFANITNPQDNVGTYSDAQGYFNLTYPDSVLHVQIRSIGFENNKVELRNNITTNQVILKDDHSLTEVVINTKKPNAAARNGESNLKMIESEPTDGWNNYDAYLANNLRAPEEIAIKKEKNKEVTVSFEVDKNGQPTNFKIEKSLCSRCDKEAIRLIKEGPKWKRSADKNARTTVIINF